jgi:glycolate oxidase
VSAAGTDLAPRSSGLDVDPENLSASVDGGMTAAALRTALSQQGFRCALADSAADGERRTLADLIGRPSNRLQMRNVLLSVEATLADGPSVRFGSTAIKDVAGYDLKRLFVGSAGSFGRVTCAAVRLERDRPSSAADGRPSS